MLPGRLKIQLIVFFLLSGGVAANLFLLQQSARAPNVEGDVTTQGFLAEQTGADRRPTGSLGVAGPGALSTEIRPRYAIEAVQRGGNSADVAVSQEVHPDPVELTRAIQRELNGRGYESGMADGLVGPVTRAAIMAFEYDRGLALTGQPTNALLKQILLGSGAAAAGRRGDVRVHSAEAKALIGSVQVSLAKLGYGPGPINGRLGPSTSRAIRKFEADQGLPVSGRISGPLISRLARIAAKRRVASGR
jgi:peptidoglycan hydrolase-like protein with peptidoglycan-binding domain